MKWCPRRGGVNRPRPPTRCSAALTAAAARWSRSNVGVWWAHQFLKTEGQKDGDWETVDDEATDERVTQRPLGAQNNVGARSRERFAAPRCGILACGQEAQRCSIVERWRRERLMLMLGACRRRADKGRKERQWRFLTSGDKESVGLCSGASPLQPATKEEAEQHRRGRWKGAEYNYIVLQTDISEVKA